MKGSLGRTLECLSHLREQLFGTWYPVTLTVIGLLSLSLSAGLALHMRSQEQRAWDKSVEQALVQHGKHIQDSLTGIEDELRAAGHVMGHAPQLNQSYFDAIASDKLKYYFGIAWVDLRHAAQPIEKGCITIGPGTHYVVRFQVNQRGAHNLVGVDLSCDHVRAAAMTAALRTGQIQSAGLVNLYQGNMPGLIAALPIWHANAPEQPAGVLLAALEFETIIDRLRGELINSSRYDLQIVDASQPGAPRLYPLQAPAQGMPFLKTDLTFAGRRLQLQLRPGLEKLRERDSYLPVAIFGVGLTVTLLLLLLLHSQVISRKRAEILSIVRSDDLVDRENRLAALFNHATIGIIRCDNKGRILQANRAAANMLSCPETALLGQEIPSLFDPRSEARLRNHRQDRIPYVSELQLNSMNGELIPVTVQILPLRSPSGEPYSWMLLEDLRDVRHAERMKMQFISTVSHELRTPLTVIRSSVELLSLETLSEDAKILLQATESNVDRLQHLINNLLDMEQLQIGALSLTQKTHDIRPVLLNVLELVEPLMAQKHLKTRFELPKNPVIAHVDDERLLQVLVNLLSNAIKFSPPAATISLSAKAENDYTRLVIEDQGPGIPEGFRSRLFQPFAQADGDDNRRWGGSGLGLYISNNLVKRMGGRITLDSEPGQGACFNVLLPADEAVSAATVLE